MVPGHHYVIDHMCYDHESMRLRFVLDAFDADERADHVDTEGLTSGFPNVLCPSDHIPIGAMFEVFPHPNRYRSEGSEPSSTVNLSEEQKSKLRHEWEELQNQKPPHKNGKPSPEEIAERKAHAISVKAWKEDYRSNSAAFEFVTSLIKQK